MCWLCDSVAPVCEHARAPDLDSYFMCGLCDPNEEESCSNLDEELLEELSGLPKTKDAGTQCGLGLVGPEAAPPRAQPRKRPLEQGIDRSGHAILNRRAGRRRRRGKCAARDLRAASWRSRALLAARRTGGRSDADGRVGAVHRKKARPDPAPLPGRTTGLRNFPISKKCK